jgi:hypothetical protein
MRTKTGQKAECVERIVLVADALDLRILDVIGSSLGRDTGYSD